MQLSSLWTYVRVVLTTNYEYDHDDMAQINWLTIDQKFRNVSAQWLNLTFIYLYGSLVDINNRWRGDTPRIFMLSLTPAVAITTTHHARYILINVTRSISHALIIPWITKVGDIFLSYNFISLYHFTTLIWNNCHQLTWKVIIWHLQIYLRNICFNFL